MQKQRIALLSVYDKTGLESFARRISGSGYRILSTGKTAAFLKDNGIAVTEVSDYTGFPEILDGRVKTLHPRIHAGILARPGHSGDEKALADLKIGTIDLVVANLYPFEKTPTMENIDIGGPTLLRAAAKNFEHVTVVCDPSDYDEVARVLEPDSLWGGKVRLGRTAQQIRKDLRSWLDPKGIRFPLKDLRKKLAAKVFVRIAEYDRSIAEYFRPETGDRRPQTEKKRSGVSCLESVVLRYGENPHQQAEWRVTPEASLWEAPLQGKELSYNNILDADAAWHLIKEWEKPFACVIVKHTNPCGVALSEVSSADAFEKAFACDSLSAFGGIVAFNAPVDAACAQKLAGVFLEIVMAPSFEKEALDVLSQKKNLRLLVMRPMAVPLKNWRSAGGGDLVQESDHAVDNPALWWVKTKRKPTAEELQTLSFAWKVAKHVKSNAIVLAKNNKTVGIGAGQMSRVDAVKMALLKTGAGECKNDCGPSCPHVMVVASDAFFPFADGMEAIAQSGATAVIQPGGSVRDAEVIAAADKHNLAMLFTGIRHFRH